MSINAFQYGKDNFPVKSIFSKVACHIARGGSLDVIGKPFEKLKEVTNIAPVINTEQNQIVGSIIYIDHYGNIISNISKSLIQKISNGRDFEINAGNAIFKKAHQSYNDIVDYTISIEDRVLKDGEKLALFNSNDLLEIAIYKSNLQKQGGASTLLGLSYRDRVTVKFKH